MSAAVLKVRVSECVLVHMGGVRVSGAVLRVRMHACALVCVL